MGTHKTTNPDAFLEGDIPEGQCRGMIPKLNRKHRYEGRSSASYYNERYASAILPTLVDMIQTRQDKEFLKDKTSKVETVYQRVQQSIAYAIDFLDEGGLLEELRKQVRLVKTDNGVVVCFAENADRYSKHSVMYKAHLTQNPFLVRNACSVDWRTAVNEFVENDTMKSLHLTNGFALTPSDVDETRTLCELMPEGCEIQVVELSQNVIHLTRE